MCKITRAQGEDEGHRPCTCSAFHAHCSTGAQPTQTTCYQHQPAAGPDCVALRPTGQGSTAAVLVWLVQACLGPATPRLPLFTQQWPPKPWSWPLLHWTSTLLDCCLSCLQCAAPELQQHQAPCGAYLDHCCLLSTPAQPLGGWVIWVHAPQLPGRGTAPVQYISDHNTTQHPLTAEQPAPHQLQMIITKQIMPHNKLSSPNPHPAHR